MKRALVIGLPQDYLPPVITVLSGEEVFFINYSGSTISKVDAEGYDSIILLCEHDADWKGRPELRQRLPGIEIAQRLRAKGVIQPIFFCSFLSRADILERIPSATILISIGSYFLQLPFNLEEIGERIVCAKPLSNIELQDVQIFHTNNEGALAELLHSLSGGKLYALVQEEDNTGVTEALVAVLRQAYALYKTDSTSAEKNLRKEFAALLRAHNTPVLTESLLPEATEMVRRLARWLAASFKPEEVSVLVAAPPEKKPWKVLVLDDELTDSSALMQELRSQVTDVIRCTSAADALQALRSEDARRSGIPVILCDYRLLMQDDDGVTVQQPIQGYTFLNQVADEFDNRIIQAVIYSGLPRRFLLRSARQLCLRCEPISKIDHRLEDPTARRYIIDTLLTLGDEAYEAMLALPLSYSSVWRSLYHKLYIQHRNLPGYEARELQIRAWCTRWAAEYLAGKGSPPPSPVVSFTDPSTRLKDLSDPFTARYLDELLKGRRLAVWLYLRQNDLVTIGKILRKPVRKESPPDKTYTVFLSQALALSLSDFPFGLTIEELNWLQYDMGLPALDAYRPLRSALLDTEEMIARFIATSENLQERLKALSDEGS